MNLAAPPGTSSEQALLPSAGSSRDSGLVCLASLLRFHKIAADYQQLWREYGVPDGTIDPVRLLQAAKHHEGVKARVVRTSLDRLSKVSLPAIAETKKGTFFVLAQVRDGKALVQWPEGAPQVLDMADLEAQWSGLLLVITTRDSLAGENRRFDITWFVPAIYKYRRLFYDVLLASLFIQIFGLITPFFSQVVIDKVLVHRGLTTLDVLAIGLIAIGIFEVVMSGLRTYLFSHTSSRVDVELSSRLFRHLLSLPISYFVTRQVGQTVARVRELETVRNFLTSSALTLVLDLAFTVIFFVVMFFYAVDMTLIVLASVPFYVALSLAITPQLRRRVEEKFQRNAANHSFLVESVGGVETIKSAAVEPQMRQKWEEQIAAYVRSSLRVVTLGTWGQQGVQLISKVVMALLLWVGATNVINGEMTVGQLVAFNMLAAQVSQPILRLAQLWQDFQQFRIALHRLGDVLNTPGEPAKQPGSVTPPPVRGEIVFDRVSFRYGLDGPQVIQSLSFQLGAGETLGIVGASGSGKSTVAKLLQRLYVPETGTIMVDGNNIALVDAAWLRRQIGVVLQENLLFNRSVRDNIALADPAAPMERIVAASQLAGAHDFILELPEGYNAMVGERGSNLSGGQRQRIAIARALVTDPRILIFDEATSALDYESERILQENMARIAKKRSVVVIAHRLSTVRRANRILVLDKGHLAEEGTHEELLALKGRYHYLYSLQQGGA
ncbi:MAG: type I secretion system permease/ATPase [Rhodospirillales bacterium]